MEQKNEIVGMALKLNVKNLRTGTTPAGKAYAFASGITIPKGGKGTWVNLAAHNLPAAGKAPARPNADLLAASKSGSLVYVRGFYAPEKSYTDKAGQPATSRDFVVLTLSALPKAKTAVAA